MSSLLSVTEKNNILADVQNIFDSISRNIIIYKEPIRTLVNPAISTNLFGFGENQNADAYVYTPVTGIFPATIKYPVIEGININPDTIAYLSAGMVSIKVHQDCRDFLLSGSTQKILVDGRSFILDGDENVRRMFTQQLYEFNLRAMK